MTDANYQKHLKVLGKLCYLYDNATAEEAAHATLRARTIDQAATGESVSLPATDLLAEYKASWSAAITAGATYLATLATTIAAAYLKLDYFLDDMTEVPANAQDAASILTALAAEMTTDSKTLTTEGSSGLVNFFDAVAGAETTLPTSGTPTYADATYVVATIV